VEETLGTKVHVELPSDRAVPMAVNRGKPVALAEPGSDFAKAIKGLADSVASSKVKAKSKTAKPSEQRKSLISKLRS
jgi:MinD-like ATPase involved in chromosome partitioning or flagellar assembly